MGTTSKRQTRTTRTFNVPGEARDGTVDIWEEVKTAEYSGRGREWGKTDLQFRPVLEGLTMAQLESLIAAAVAGLGALIDEAKAGAS